MYYRDRWWTPKRKDMKRVLSSLAAVGLCVSMILANPTTVYSEKALAQSIDPNPGVGELLYPKLTDEEKEELLDIAVLMLYSDKGRDSIANARERAAIGENGYYGYNNRWGIMTLTDEERELLAEIVWLEGGNQGLKGQELVVVTILNRTLDESFEDDVEGVLSQDNQFETWPIRWKSQPTDETYQAIEDVLSGKADEDIINSPWLYFNTSSGTYKYKAHWFR